MKISSLSPLLGILLFISCNSDDDPKINCEKSDLIITLVEQNDPACDQPGSFTVMAEGGTSPYEFRLSGTEEFSTQSTFSNLTSGTYEVIVIDGTDCTSSLSVVVEGVDPIILQIEKGGCSDGEGELSITASGGSGNFQFQLDEGSLGTGSSFTGLDFGTYTVTVVDDTGCSTVQDVEVQALSLVSDVWPIIETNCALNGCHGNSQSPIFDDVSSVIDNAEEIRVQVVSGNMPRGGGTLTDEEINTIAEWVDCGANDN